MQLVIVESPAKAKTIEKYLGPGFRVLASYGHVRDLPAKDGSVEPDNGFAMHWEVSADRAKQLKAIVDEAKTASNVILATDPDREGEAISWHLNEYLKGKKALKSEAGRVTFNEITKTAVTTAMGRPRALDQDLVDAYRARRALDYLVGFNLSPVLWRKLPGAKSAGRVQSVALRLVVDREREVEAFRAREYWTVDADFGVARDAFSARLVELDGAKLDKFALADAETAMAAKRAVEGTTYAVGAVETKPGQRHPAPPFITSTLQQEAARKLGFSASHTMRIAQQLYEEGAITYMRTDGVQLSNDAVAAARAVIGEDFGGEYVPAKPVVYKSKQKNAQEAHEAVRPTEMARRPGKAGLSGDHARLYELVWKRTLACQMAPARIERTTVTLRADDGRAVLRASGTVTLFPGFLAVYQEDRDEPETPGEADEDSRKLPRLTQGQRPALTGVRAEQHHTEPPPRFSEASLVKQLEALGIGRPSTYASILQTLKDREYVRVEKNRFHPEEKGRLVTAFLERFFERYVSYDFTAGLEEQLDDVSAGEAAWKAVLAEFWRDFEPKTKEVMEQKPSEVTQALDEFLGPYLFPDPGDGSDPRQCKACGTGRLSLRGGKFGAFVACSNYPECRYTRPFADAGGATSAPARTLGVDPDTAEPVELKSGRFGAYVQRGPDKPEDGGKPRRASLPKDMDADTLDLAGALRLLSLPRLIGTHPETGKPITANLGRFGPYLAHDGEYRNLQTTAEVFETGMNMAVARLAEPKRQGRQAAGPLKELGPHPATGAPVKLMPGRFGPYVTDGTTNASLPKGADPDALAIDEAVSLLAARAEAAPPKGAKRQPARAAAKAAPAKTARKPVAKAKPKPRRKATAPAR